MKRSILFAAAALMMLTACNQEEIEPATERLPVKLAYKTIDAIETRAAQNLNEGTFESGEAIKVQISNTGVGEWTDYTFTTDADGAMTAPEPAPYYPAGSQNIDIVACYPATAGDSFTVYADQTDDADYKASDLMFASVTNQAKQAEAVNLAFSHKMAKLCVNITAGAGVTNITSVSILNVKPTVSFDRTTGVVGEASGNAITIAMCNNGAALIPPQTINGGLLSIVTDKGTATYSVPAGKAFEAGKLYTLNITVNLRAVGTTNAITGWTSEGTVTVNPVPDTTPVAIDMGHPGGVKWANMNVGATSESSSGDYFAWGATVPYYQEGYSHENPCTHWIDGKSGYNWANYPFMQSGESSYKYITKYTFADGQTSAIWYSGETFIGDGKASFADYDYADDAARQNWGAGWRTPTDAEWKWLIDNCTWTWTSLNGEVGMLVTSNIAGYTDKSIFLPAAGQWSDAKFGEAGTVGYYWSSTLGYTFSDYARYVYFYSTEFDRSVGVRYIGRCVRPVTE